MTGRNKKTCAGPECDLPARSLGFCAGHYQQHHAGRELAPRIGKQRSYQPGDQLYHGQRPCKFFSAASPAFLMLAAFLGQRHGDTEWAAGVASRCAHGDASIKFVIYDDDRSIGVLRRTQLSRRPKAPSKSHWYAQQVMAADADR